MENSKKKRPFSAKFTWDNIRPAHVAPKKPRKRAKSYSQPVPAAHITSQFLDNSSGEFSYDIVNSQSLLENLSLTQDTNLDKCKIQSDVTSACDMFLATQLEEKLPPAYMSLVFESKMNVTVEEREKLENLNLHVIIIRSTAGQLTLGRTAFSSVFGKRINDALLSREHCILSWRAEECSSRIVITIRDESSNGTTLNGHLIGKEREIELRHDDVIGLRSNHIGVVIGYRVTDFRDELGCNLDRVSYDDNTVGILFSAPLIGIDSRKNYHEVQKLDLDTEYEMICESLTNCNEVMASTQTDDDIPIIKIPQRLNINVKFATTEALKNMVTLGLRVLHFSGHSNECQVYLEDGRSNVHPMSHQAIQEMFCAGGSPTKVKLVCISSCYSERLGKLLVKAGVKHMIAIEMSDKIEDRAAVKFSSAFYFALGRGKSVQESFDIAKQQVKHSALLRHSEQASKKFLLLPRDGDHSEIIFPMIAMERNSKNARYLQLPVTFPKLQPDDIPKTGKTFCGREVDMNHLCCKLMSPITEQVTHLYGIYGDEGVGKTSLAIAVGEYISRRRIYGNGVKYYSIEELKDEVLSEKPRKSGHQLRLGVISKLDECIRQRHIDNSEIRGILVIIDGCDYLVEEERGATAFRKVIRDSLRRNSQLIILLTAREFLSFDVVPYLENKYTLHGLQPKYSARLLLSLMNRMIKFEECSKSIVKSEDLNYVLMNHPAVLTTQGNPKLIANLASQLCRTDERVQLDSLIPKIN